MGGETLNDFARTLIHLSDDRLQREYLNVVEQTEAIAQILSQLEPDQALRIVRLGLDIDLGLGSQLAGSLAPTLQPQAIQMILDLGLSKVATVTLLKLTGSAAALPYLQLGLENDSDYFEVLRLELGYEPGAIASEPYLAECGIEEQEPFAIETHRLQIAGAIAAIEHPEAAQLLQKHLGDCDTQNLLAVYTRYNILRQLEYGPNSQAIALLLNLIQQPPNWMLQGPPLDRSHSMLLDMEHGKRKNLEPILQKMIDSPAVHYSIGMAMQNIELAGLDEMATVEVLASVIDDESEKSEFAKHKVLRALAKLGGPTADELIRHSLCHPYGDPPHIIARLYRERWGAQQGILEISQCLKGGDPWVQRQVLRVLRYLVKEDVSGGWMFSGEVEDGIAALQILEQSLDLPIWSVRLVAAQLLTEFIAEFDLGVDRFCHVYYYDPDFRITEPRPSWDCFKRLDREKILHTLTAQFDEQDLEQRKATIQALAWLQADASKPLLLQILQQASESTIRGYAGRALGYFRDRSLLPDLITALNQEADPEARAQIIIGLCYFTEVGPVPSELEAVFFTLAQDILDSADIKHFRAIHDSAAYALGRVNGDKAIQMLEQLLRRYLGLSTMRALGHIASPRTVDFLSRALVGTMQSSPKAFYDGEDLIRSLAEAGTPQAFDALLEPLPYGHSSDSHTQIELARHGRLEHVPRLWEVVKQHRSTGFHEAIAAIQERCGYYNPNFTTTDSPAQTDSSPSPA